VTPLLLDIIVKATAVLALGWIADMLLRGRGSAAARHLVWTLAVAALLALPIASIGLPRWTVGLPLAPAVSESRVNAYVLGLKVDSFAVNEDLSRLKADSTGLQSSSSALQRKETSSITPAVIAATLAIVYLAIALLLLTRLALEPIALRRLARASRELTDPEWRALLDETQTEMGVTDRVRLVQATRDVMPLTFGTLAPTVVLPASADAWTDDRRRAVLLHELAHIARRDCFVQRLTAIASALYWPHPGVWWAARRLRVERELACDDRVLAAGEGAREYAGHLLELAHSLGSAPAPATALGMARPRQLETRLLAVLDAARNRTGIRKGARTVAAVVALVILAPLVAVRAEIVPRHAGRDAGSRNPVYAALAQAAQAVQPGDLSGTWDLRLSRDPGMAQITVHTEHGTHGRSIAVAQLPVSAAQLTAAASTVSFPIARDAGTFHVEGICRNGVCGGTLTFEPSATFAAELASRGLARPTATEQMTLAMADIGVGFLDELSKNGYAKPDLAGLVRAAQHGVDTGYVRDMASFGYKVGTLDALVKLRDHGIDAAYVRGMTAAGFTRLPADQILAARDHGVDPAYVNAMRDLGFRAGTLDEIVKLRDHGIDPEYVRGMAAAGIGTLNSDQILTARDHGIDPEYVRGMQAHGYRLTFGELLETRNHGIDPEYVDGLGTLGYKGLSVEALMQARNHGVDPEYIRSLSAVGYKNEPLDALIKMRSHGVDAEYIRRVQQKGLGHLSVDELIQRRDRGLDDPDAAARAVAAQVQSLWRSILMWVRS
jgi:beta-lactamase regulating signal transducer with metallopeptidase domain